MAVDAHGSGKVRMRHPARSWLVLPQRSAAAVLPQCCRSAAAVLRVGSCVPSVYLLLAPLLEYYLVSLLVLLLVTAGRLLVRVRVRGF